MNSKEKTKYRQSKKWKDFRKTIMDDCDSTCQICGVKKYGKSKRGLQLHHLNPESYGHEKKEDVVLLCSSCHKNIEKLLVQNKKKNSIFDIEEYLNKVKEVYYKSGGE